MLAHWQTISLGTLFPPLITPWNTREFAGAGRIHAGIIRSRAGYEGRCEGEEIGVWGLGFGNLTIDRERSSPAVETLWMATDNKLNARMVPIQHFMQAANQEDERGNYRIFILNEKCAVRWWCLFRHLAANMPYVRNVWRVSLDINYIG